VTSPLLDVSGVTLTFGGFKVLDDVSLSVGTGECVGLIGPNGAGKSSVLNCVTRNYRNELGSVTFADRSLDDVRPHDVVRGGIARTFQNVELSPTHTVLRNTLVGAHSRMRASFVEGLFGLTRSRRDEVRVEAEARELLARFGLGARVDRPLGELPYGSRKLVEIARALLGRPRMLLLDEPVAGTSSDERAEIGAHIRELAKDQGLSMVLVEHDVKFVRSMADRIVVLDFGRVIASGQPDEVLRQPTVISAYLGEGSTTDQ